MTGQIIIEFILVTSLILIVFYLGCIYGAKLEQEEREKKIEEMKVENEQIEEFNKINKRQIELLKENKELKDKVAKYY